jgi:hypothetical protein
MRFRLAVFTRIFQAEYSTNIPNLSNPQPQTALGRIGNPEDLGKVILSLLSDDFGWVGLRLKPLKFPAAFCFKPALLFRSRTRVKKATGIR